MYNTVSPDDIRSQLLRRYNCKIQQSVASSNRCIEVTIHKLIKTKKLFNLIPFNEYEPTIKTLPIDSEVEVKRVYSNGRVDFNKIEVAYCIDNDTLYWRYLS